MKTIIFSLTIFCFLVFCTLTSIFANAQVERVRAILRDREASLERLVAKAEELEKTRCARLASWSSSRECLVPSCGNSFPSKFGFKCEKDYGDDHDTCGSNCDGLIRSVNKSTVLFADQTSNNDANIQSFLSYADNFKNQAQIERSTVRAWMGLASFSGASTWYPGSPRNRGGTCSPYDPRLRSWYVAASSGPKDVVIVLDVSGSMSATSTVDGPTRLSLLQDATKALLGTLNFNDYFAVVSFSTDGNIITASGSPVLLQATEANKESAKRSIDDLIANGNTNFMQGFNKAFQIFQSSTEATSGCKRIVLFLTDGQPSDSNHVSQITTLQNTLGANKANVFTFTMGNGAADYQQTPRDIACAFSGIQNHIAEGVNPLTQMAQYYKFLALTINSTNPSYVYPYLDSFGLGLMTTVSKAFRDNSSGTPVFAGVVEIDIPMGELTPFLTETEIINELNLRGATCPTYNVSECYLQLLRNAAGYECPAPAQSLSSCRAGNSVSENPVCTALLGGINSMLCDQLHFSTLLSTSGVAQYKEVVCCSDCGLSVAAIIGIVIGSLVGVTIVIGIVYLVAVKGAATASGSVASVSVSNPDATTARQNNYIQNAPNGQWSTNYPGLSEGAPYPQPSAAFAQPVYGQPVPTGYGAPIQARA